MIVPAPWTPEQVRSLEEYQACDHYHEYTLISGKPLIPTVDGFVEWPNGPVVQTWAHDWTLDWSWKRNWKRTSPGG